MDTSSCFSKWTNKFLKALKLNFGFLAGGICIHAVSRSEYLKAPYKERMYEFECDFRATNATVETCPFVWAVPVSMYIVWTTAFITMALDIYSICVESSVKWMKQIDFAWHMIATVLALIAGSLLIAYSVQAKNFDCGPFDKFIPKPNTPSQDKEMDEYIQKHFPPSSQHYYGGRICKENDDRSFQQDWFLYRNVNLAGITSIIDGIIYFFCGFITIVLEKGQIGVLTRSVREVESKP